LLPASALFGHRIQTSLGLVRQCTEHRTGLRNAGDNDLSIAQRREGKNIRLVVTMVHMFSSLQEGVGCKETIANGQDLFDRQAAIAAPRMRIAGTLSGPIAPTASVLADLECR
jgi:hypothetical protein